MISERTNGQGITFLDIETDYCTACLCLQGAHLTSWIPRGHGECLFTSCKARYEPGKAIRGGIPLCWPWFGKREGAPSHGIARISAWEIDHYGIDPTDGVASIHLRLFPSDDRMPAAFLRITLASELRMRLQTTSRKACGSLTTAFHNYLRVGDVRNCLIHGLSGLAYHEHGEKCQSHGKGPVNPGSEGAMDRIYSSRKPVRSVTLEDPDLRRTLTITTENSHSMVVWNPWEDGARVMDDLADDEWPQFICLEPAVTDPAMVQLSPGQTHVMRQVIKVAAL